jgi:hypothetical protein
MRLEGFEPPTRGLEGRRSSTELQAPVGLTMRSVDVKGRNPPSERGIEGSPAERRPLVTAEDVPVLYQAAGRVGGAVS